MKFRNNDNTSKSSTHVFKLFFYIFWILIVSAMGSNVHAQTFAEWFRQNSTQKKYLLQQIAALQLLGGYVRDGYRIAGKGLGSISGYLSSEYTLHSGFYSRLETADPSIRESPEITEILNWRSEILKALGPGDAYTGLMPQEQQYVARVGDVVQMDCDSQIAHLEQVITDGQLKMNDSERLRLIGQIHGAMQDTYRFVLTFLNSVSILVIQRQQEKNAIQTSNALYFKH
ncbi:hypothetical protein ACEN9X_14435 [Mucilaginibacter sp. Mucisp86]|uniref:hypothetical protein n=1 Tax=Mucilaginibacter sp. Mucisp86 TaxID=3243060 RepID=UPI0039B3F86A